MEHGSSRNVPGINALDTEKLSQYFFEVGPIRPPSEGGSFSLLIRATRNCPWSRCAFCYGALYNHERFELRSVNEIKADIDAPKGVGTAKSSVKFRPIKKLTTNRCSANL